MNAESELKRLAEQLNQLNMRQQGIVGNPIFPPIPTNEFQQTPQQGPVTADQVSSIIETSLKRAMPQLMGMIQSIDDFFVKALPPDELAAFKTYRDQGAPGLKELMESGALYPVAQLLWDEIKSQATKQQGDK